MKVCSSCKETLEYSCYNIRSKSSDGYEAACKACRSKRRKDYESQKIYNKQYYHENKESLYNKKELWYKENPDKKLLHRQNYRKNNLESIQKAERLKHLNRRTRVPTWLTPKQKEQIQNFYILRDEARMLTGEEYHVDHIIPLQGKTVCGLHVPWNLQVLPADINLSKNNRFSGNTGGMMPQ